MAGRSGAAQRRPSRSLFDPSAEHDACGVGLVATMNGPQHEVLRLALDALDCLQHRGALDADAETGDGAGILAQVPHQLFADDLAALDGPATAPGELGVGVFYLPTDREARARAEAVIQAALAAESIPHHAWRPVPLDSQALGPTARASCPSVEHLLVVRPASDDLMQFERRLYRLRRRIERGFTAAAPGRDDHYVVSLSARTVVYKGLMLAPQLSAFYRDLANPAFATSAAIFHQRYSTNTTPSWRRAQPFRRLAHNGEINTLRGNVNWMRARQGSLDAPYWRPLGDELWPVVDPHTSDSGMLDNTVELLDLSDRTLPHVMMMLVPEAWEGIPELDAHRRDFYRYHSCLMEPWDGPAGLVFGDGGVFGATLDRNGLRPMRYTLTHDGWVVIASEAGAVRLDPGRVRRYGKLGPGQMLCVDLEAGRVLEPEDVKASICNRRPYGNWLHHHLRGLSPADGVAGRDGVAAVRSVSDGGAPLRGPASSDGPAAAEVEVPERLRGDRLEQWKRAFAYTQEEIAAVIRPMVENGKEPVGSMGDDTPHAVLSRKERPFSHYLKERFAEVTNPPIDHLREDIVFSLRTQLGPRRNLLAESAEHAHLIELRSPVLFDGELALIWRMGEADAVLRSVRLDIVFPRADGPEGLEPAVERLCQAATAAVDGGAGILVLSDRALDAAHVAIPALMAVAAVHHHLVRTGRRSRVSLVAQCGEARDIHDVCSLLGYGANAVNPHLALALIADLVEAGRMRKLNSVDAAIHGYRHALEEGLKKVMSKMGISTVDSYSGAQIFEAIGIDDDVIERCFPGTASRVRGNGFREFGELMLAWHRGAFPEVTGRPALSGFYRHRDDGEIHEFSPAVVESMHAAVRTDLIDFSGPDRPEGYERYESFARTAQQGPPTQLRHLLDFRPDREPIPVEEVEPVEAITRRFSTGSMSLGSLSPEAHETLAIAMNRIGGRSGSGEGGEDPSRFGNERNSAIKQVASGRFGVRAAYLASAQELQIKMAQGSKPGEGGQIPGQKVTDYIARIRRTIPGVALISPPPHHDIYSIEDLAQLIYDLKQINPEAEVSVKLVAETGVGIIAAGVAKGHADIILISGHSGGTGSSPLNSIKNAGLPWEIGLAETQQTLVANNLRDRVVLRADGGLRTGRDVVMAALLGADHFSFGSAAMVAEGCIMMRVCHTDNCPVGVATQREALRKKFTGRPEHVMNYFLLMAQEIRELLAHLGYRGLDEVIGRVDLLHQVRTGDPAADRLDLSPLLAVPEGCEDRPRRHMGRRNALPPEDRLDARLAERFRAAADRGHGLSLSLPIRNTDRTVGATLSFEIARRYGDDGLPPDTVRCTFEGEAGQSFGAFLAAGVTFDLVGQANDYVGKGLAGGEVVIRPDPRLREPSHVHVLLGNTVLYGATGGILYAAGRAGERFAVRNSGAVAVVEGVGDHGCEYMTGGTVVVLGSTGYNFAAGMTGGEAFVLDQDGRFAQRFNPQLVHLTPMLEQDETRLYGLIEAFAERTGSQRAREILDDWDTWRPRIVRLAPKDEVREISSEEEGAVMTP